MSMTLRQVTDFIAQGLIAEGILDEDGAEMTAILPDVASVFLAVVYNDQRTLSLDVPIQHVAVDDRDALRTDMVAALSARGYGGIYVAACWAVFNDG